MNSKLKRVAARNDLSEILYVRQDDHPTEPDSWALEATDERMKLVDKRRPRVIGVYQLIGVEQIEHVETHTVKNLVP